MDEMKDAELLHQSALRYLENYLSTKVWMDGKYTYTTHKLYDFNPRLLGLNQ